MASDSIYIRRYRPADFPQIRALLFEGFVTSEGSTSVVAQQRFLFKAPSLIAYLLGGAGLGLLSRPGSWTTRTAGAGAALCAAGIALFTTVRRAIPRALTAHCETALATDMRDISAHYRAPAGFFVAAQPRIDQGEAAGDEEVVGFVGFDYLPEQDAQTAEVRRVVVSAKHRRRGIGVRLMHAVIAHADTIPGLRCIELNTGEFQLASQRLYERLGWESFRVETLWAGIVDLKIVLRLGH
ncbi:acyl-CoA N-acyltransferase [Mycena rosella]|uniref:Acyl-CoA N-acyltransferase n=1 Tax=Mycena rosella TaxID=1033263 RepID=A0AAD7GMM2_MYCRO|nr:acyl-CoA N-acyltransferase [Mycena rosella]